MKFRQVADFSEPNQGVVCNGVFKALFQRSPFLKGMSRAYNQSIVHPAPGVLVNPPNLRLVRQHFFVGKFSYCHTKIDNVCINAIIIFTAMLQW